MFKRLPALDRFCSYTCAQYQPPTIFAERDSFQPQILKRRWNQKIRVPGGGGDLKSSFHIYLHRGERGRLLCFLSKNILKIKYGFEGSNVDLGLFKPNKQLMFSFVTLSKIVTLITETM